MKKQNVQKKWIALAFVLLLGVLGAATVQAADDKIVDQKLAEFTKKKRWQAA